METARLRDVSGVSGKRGTFIYLQNFLIRELEISTNRQLFLATNVRQIREVRKYFSKYFRKQQCDANCIALLVVLRVAGLPYQLRPKKN